MKEFGWIKDQQIPQSYIWDSFALCGFNPYFEYQSRFKEHLDSLYENMAYDSLLCTEESMKLKGDLDGLEDDTSKEDDTKD